MTTRRFECVAGCSACCRRAGTLVLTRPDMTRLAAHLGLSLGKFEKKYLNRIHGQYHVRMKGPKELCPFLGGDETHGWCRVHEAKPTQCSTYPFWNGVADNDAAWAREAKFCPGIGQGPVIPASLVQIQIEAATLVDKVR